MPTIRKILQILQFRCAFYVGLVVSCQPTVYNPVQRRHGGVTFIQLSNSSRQWLKHTGKMDFVAAVAAAVTLPFVIMSEMMLLLQARFCNIYNDWQDVKIRRGENGRTAVHPYQPYRNDKRYTERMGYILEEHNVTLWRVSY